jgi:hypothetical protein
VDPAAWQLLRGSHGNATGKALAKLADAESKLMGDAGMVLGYGLRASESSLHWFLDGYVFDSYVPGKTGRKPYAQDWLVAWQVPQTWNPGMELTLPISFTGHARQVEGGAGGGVHVEIKALCGPRLAMVRAFDALDRRDAQATDMLRELAQACASDPKPLAMSEVLAQAQASDAAAPVHIERRLHVPALAEVPGASADKNVRRLLLSLRVFASAAPGMPGEALLRGAEFHYIYAPPVRHP